jgi:ammonium transporter, Amt family
MSNGTALYNQADISFMFANSALVLFMTPGLAFFYSGLVNRKNVVSTLMQSFATLGVVAIQWWFWGFSLAYGEGGVFYGDLNMMLLANYKIDLLATGHQLIPTVPVILFAIYELMFATITPALITGSMGERVR